MTPLQVSKIDNQNNRSKSVIDKGIASRNLNVRQ